MVIHFFVRKNHHLSQIVLSGLATFRLYPHSIGKEHFFYHFFVTSKIITYPKAGANCAFWPCCLKTIILPGFPAGNFQEIFSVCSSLHRPKPTMLLRKVFSSFLDDWTPCAEK